MFFVVLIPDEEVPTLCRKTRHSYCTSFVATYKATGNFELTLNSMADFEEAKAWIRRAFDEVGG